MIRFLGWSAILIMSLTCLAADYPVYPAFGTTYVQLDSWVYPAFDRLAALGYAPSAFHGIKPWTRLECARLLEEFNDASGGSETPVDDVVANLRAEFARELETLEG